MNRKTGRSFPSILMLLPIIQNQSRVSIPNNINVRSIVVCRWGNTPADDALQSGHVEIVEYIDDYEEKLKLGLRPTPEGGMLGPTSPTY